ncbi:MAG TPA: molybdopterin-synthase adenylyltransferase MoeB [Gemmatimonadales bacterium]|nr:molybdopterin-synthase adenylyltransferase MoeB [Gemmatimonadales bacterium]
MLAPDQLQRFARHLTLPEVGVAGQERLHAARVLLIGAGGLGSPAALYLAAAGIGTLGIIDDDVVDLSNLQRQVVHGTAAIGLPKVESARARLADLNPGVTLLTFGERLTSDNARAIIRQFDLVIDGSDNFPTRYLVNDACLLERVPFVYGSIYRFEGQLSVFGAPDGPCYRCLFAEPPAPELVPSCIDAGVLGVLPGIIGTLQALEAIKWILGIGTSMVGRLMLFDALKLEMREITLRRDPACAMCGTSPAITELVDYEAFCGSSAASPHGRRVTEILPTDLLRRRTTAPAPVQLDVREPWEFEIAHIPGSILIPLGELAERYTELPPGVPVVTICHHGMRSRQAAALLGAMGVGEVASLAGGVDAWAETVDPHMARY